MHISDLGFKSIFFFFSHQLKLVKVLGLTSLWQFDLTAIYHAEINASGGKYTRDIIIKEMRI